MADERNEKPQVFRSPEPGVEAAREAEERRVAEIERDLKEFGRRLTDRRRLARFAANRAQSSPVQVGKPAGDGEDRATPEAQPRTQRKLVAGDARPARRRKLGPSLAAAIIVLFLVSGGALMLMGHPIEIAQDAYRSAVAETQALTTRRNDAREQAERAEAGLNLSDQDRKRVQVALSSLGHEIPTITGYFGPRTRTMITAWQKTQGLPETGYLTEVQLAVLQQQAAAALAKYDQAQ